MDSVPLSAIDAVCRFNSRRKVITSRDGYTTHRWKEGDTQVVGPHRLYFAKYRDGVCVHYRRIINSLHHPSEVIFMNEIWWTWAAKGWCYDIGDDEWFFTGDNGDKGMWELCPDLRRLPLASDDVKILMELTYG